MNDQLIANIAENEHRNAVLALLRQIADNTAAIREAMTGEKPFRTKIVGYIRGQNKGGDFVWLYSDHPAVEAKVAVVYGDDKLWSALPLGDFLNVAICDDKGPPMRDEALTPAYAPYYTTVDPFIAETVKREASNSMGSRVYLTGVYPLAGNGHSAPAPTPAPASVPPADDKPDEVEVGAGHLIWGKKEDAYNWAISMTAFGGDRTKIVDEFIRLYNQLGKPADAAVMYREWETHIRNQVDHEKRTAAAETGQRGANRASAGNDIPF